MSSSSTMGSSDITYSSRSSSSTFRTRAHSLCASGRSSRYSRKSSLSHIWGVSVVTGGVKAFGPIESAGSKAASSIPGDSSPSGAVSAFRQATTATTPMITAHVATITAPMAIPRHAAESPPDVLG
ncbi:MAG: hypothetical protein DYH08_09480 [Actinobacteria bacterium ATB1]|nr:hypothetical protein [Actinobacteria bacterium ATB1]